MRNTGKRLNKIYEICSQYPRDIDEITAMAKIATNCNPDYLADDIEWRLQHLQTEK